MPSSNSVNTSALSRYADLSKFCYLTAICLLLCGCPIAVQHQHTNSQPAHKQHTSARSTHKQQTSTRSAHKQQTVHSEVRCLFFFSLFVCFPIFVYHHPLCTPHACVGSCKLKAMPNTFALLMPSSP